MPCSASPPVGPAPNRKLIRVTISSGSRPAVVQISTIESTAAVASVSMATGSTRACLPRTSVTCAATGSGSVG